VGASNIEVEQFLVAYAEALSAGDGAALAGMYEIPGLVVSDQGGQPVSSPDQVAEFFAAAAAQYHDAGLAGTRPEYVSIEQLSEQLCTADVRWIGIDADGRATGHKEYSMYVLRRGEDGVVRIQVAVIRSPEVP
jgi:ketosteroid isomerase-like protein